MNTPANRQNWSARVFDIVVFVSLALICLGGVTSIFLSSSKGLALTEFLISFGGLVVSFLMAAPAVLGRWQTMVQQRLGTALRVVILLAVLGTFALQAVIIRVQVTGSTPPAQVTGSTPSVQPSNFLYTNITQSNGQALPTQQPVNISLRQVPLIIAGTYTSAGTGEVWVVVVDRAGQYYLQVPSVRFADGGQQGVWRAYNVFTNEGTLSINFIFVPQREQFFQNKAQNHDYKAFSDLPAVATVLLSITIRVTA